MSALLLIHGGLWEDMDADRFWHRPGIVTALRDRGVDAIAPDRPRHPSSWAAEVDQLAASLPDRPVTVLGASNSCTVAVRLAMNHPERVARLVLAWPATAGDQAVDARFRAWLTGRGASAEVVDGLLAGETLRGVADEELAGLTVPVGVLPSAPENSFHRRATVDALLRLIPQAVELPGCPEPPRPEFPPHLDKLAATLAEFGRG
ncbi:MAG TPA: alpha/beta hydrolase [Natronosporangium sp.]